MIVNRELTEEDIDVLTNRVKDEEKQQRVLASNMRNGRQSVPPKPYVDKAKIITTQKKERIKFQLKQLRAMQQQEAEDCEEVESYAEAERGK